jgi:hypothetical protein
MPFARMSLSVMIPLPANNLRRRIGHVAASSVARIAIVMVFGYLGEWKLRRLPGKVKNIYGPVRMIPANAWAIRSTLDISNHARLENITGSFGV